MTRTSALILATVLVVSVAGAAATAGVGATGEGDSTSCTCTSVDLQSGSVDLVVLANRTGGASVSQQIVQNGDRVRVTIDLEYDSTSVEIAGETVANGSLVLTVTQDGDVVNDSVVVNGSESDSVVFHVDPDDVRITREDVPCERVCEDDVTVDDGHQPGDGDDPDVDVNVGDGVEVNVDADGADSPEHTECKNASVEDVRDAAIDHSSDVAIGVNELKFVSQPIDVAELTRRVGDCNDAVGGPATGEESD